MAGRADLRELRAKVRAIEGGGGAVGREVARLGPGLDTGLPWGGLPSGCLHEVAGPAAPVAAAAFARRLAGDRGVVAWCLDDRTAEERGGGYGPGLRPFGIDPARLLLVRARDRREGLWAFAEAPACRAPARAGGGGDPLRLLRGRPPPPPAAAG